MKKILIFVALCAIVLFGGKFYLEHRYEKELREALFFASQFATIRFSGVEIGFDGSIAINDLFVKSQSGPESVEIKQVKVRTSSRLFPVLGPKVFEGGKYPEFINFSAEEATFDIDVIEQFNTEEECSDLSTAFVYSGIGVSMITTNVEIGVDFSDLSNSEMVLTASDKSSKTEMRFTFDVNEMKDTYATRESMPFTQISVTSSLDSLYATRFNDYCAEKLGVTTKEYLSSIVTTPKYSIDSFGVDLGKKVSEALPKFMQGGSTLRVTSRPAKQLKNLNAAKFYETRDVIRWLRLSVLLDEESVTIDPNASVNNAAIAAAEAEETTEVTEVAVATNNNKQSKAVTNTKRSYQVTALKSANKHLYSKVRIWRKGDKSKLKGRLISFKQGVLAVEIRRYGGKAVYEVAASDVKRFEVYR